MSPYGNPHFDIIHPQKNVNNQLLETCYSSSSSSFDNFDLNNELLRQKVEPIEVWGETFQEEYNVIPFEQQQRENTIHKFLVKAGGIYPQPLMAIDPTVMASQQDDWFKNRLMQHERQEMNILAQNGVYNNYDDINGNSATMSSLLVPARRSLVTEDVIDKTVERRRKRMIKNRESAARSRARKQAHTRQLELQVLELKQKNSLLKKYKEVRKHLSKDSPSEPRYQLRRTRSSLF